jgi:alpha-glucoside transport system permease protein
MDFLKSIATIAGGIAAFAGVFLLLYFLVSKLPGRWRERLEGWPFILIAMVFAVGGLLISAIRTFVISLRDETGRKFVGIDNYKAIWSDTESRLSVVNSLFWVFVATFITVAIGLTIARYSDGIRGERLIKTMIFLPVAISLIGAGITWRFIYSERGVNFSAGLLNELTKALRIPPSFGGGAEGRNWMLERLWGPSTPPEWFPGFNTVLLIVIFVWAQAGIATTVLSAAIKGVPTELLEAARVDGGSKNEIFYKVTMPYIKGTVATVTSLVALASLKAFDIIFAASSGNFGTATLATQFYRKFYTQQNDGLGSAFAVLLFLSCYPIVVWNRRVQRHVDETM